MIAMALAVTITFLGTSFGLIIDRIDNMRHFVLILATPYVDDLGDVALEIGVMIKYFPRILGRMATNH